MKFKKWTTALLISSSIIATSGVASAHVTVWPKESKADSYERFTVRVPNEKDNNTIKVRLEFPASEKIGSVLPVSGWSYVFEKDSEGRFKAITWTAENGGGVRPNEFVEFGLSGKNPKEMGNLAWKAYQTYADGTTVEWTGDDKSKTPAPVITITEGDKTGDGHEENKQPAAEPKKETPADTKSSGNNTLPIALSGAALLVSLISLFRKRG